MKKYFSLIILVIITFISCEDSEINLGESNLIENQTNFQVDFDGQTYHADYVDASIVDGIITMKALKVGTNEFVVITLNNDQEGLYTLSPNDNVGELKYKKDEDDTFITSPTAYSGRVDVTQITNNKLFGSFSFIGVRMIPLLDVDENPVLDIDNNPVYTEEIKNFTNGIFSNITFSTTIAVNTDLEPEPEPTNDTFFMKIDDVEFVETTLSAEKITVDTVEVIQIQATNDGSNHVFKLQMPADVIFGSSHELQGTTSSPASESIATYRIISLSHEYKPYSGIIAVPILRIISHDTDTNKIVGTFEFSGKHGVLLKEFTEGAFSVTYTE